MSLDKALIRKICLGLSWLAFGLAALLYCGLACLVYAAREQLYGIGAIFVYGAFGLLLVFAGFAFRLAARNTAVSRAGTFLMGLLIVGGLLYPTTYRFYLFGPFGMDGGILAFLVVAELQARASKRQPSPAVGAWLGIVRFLGFVVGIAVALYVVGWIIGRFEISHTFYWVLQVGVTVATLVLAIRLSGLTSWSHEPLSLVRDSMAKSEAGLPSSSSMTAGKISRHLLGKISLASTLLGLAVPVAGIFLILTFANIGRMGQVPERTAYQIYGCLGLLAIAQAAALCTGLMAWRTGTGKAGAGISGAILLLLIGGGLCLVLL
jgi:hypothetical protein